MVLSGMCQRSNVWHSAPIKVLEKSDDGPGLDQHPWSQEQAGNLGWYFQSRSSFASIQNQMRTGEGTELPCLLPCDKCGPGGHPALGLLGSTRNHLVHWECWMSRQGGPEVKRIAVNQPNLYPTSLVACFQKGSRKQR